MVTLGGATDQFLISFPALLLQAQAQDLGHHAENETTMVDPGFCLFVCLGGGGTYLN